MYDYKDHSIALSLEEKEPARTKDTSVLPTPASHDDVM